MIKLEKICAVDENVSNKLPKFMKVLWRKIVFRPVVKLKYIKALINTRFDTMKDPEFRAFYADSIALDSEFEDTIRNILSNEAQLKSEIKSILNERKEAT